MTATGSAAGDRVRLGFTGVGKRGADLLGQCAGMEDVAIPAVCDVQQRRLDAVEETLENAGRPAPARYDDHETMLASADLDAVVIATSWRHHVPMAIRAMEAGVWPGLDVGPASSVEECWDLVRTAEVTGEHCMLLENCCYRRDRMAVLNMVREGLFGELVHCECGYAHDLRGRLNSVAGTSREETARDLADGRYFRSRHHEKRNGDLYPTHGVGPMAKCLGINRGNQFVSLTATASKSRGLGDWAERNLEPGHPSRDVDWAHGDVIDTVIECADGETLTVTHDVNLPRPDNSKRYCVRGTRAISRYERDAMYVDGRSPDHEWEAFEDYRDEFEHPLWETYRERGVHGGHGGSDYLVLRTFVESVARGVTPPIDVYDAAAWKAITPLSEASISRGSAPVSFPDFTNGDWLADEPIFGLTGTVGEDRLDFETVS